MRRIVGALLLLIAAVPLAFLPLEIVWGVLECGPVNSGCHHFPYRLVTIVIVLLVIGGIGLLLLKPRRPR